MRTAKTAPILCLLPLLAATLAAQKPPKKNPIIVEFLQTIGDKDHFVRRDQVERLARVQTPEAVGLLLKKGLTDAEDIVRERAVWALSRMKETEARQTVLEGLSSSDTRIRSGTALALGGMEEPAFALEPLIGILGGDRSAAVRVAAAEALGVLGDEGATDALVAALNDRNYEVVIAAADSLGLIRPLRAAQALCGLLRHANWRVQVAALNALGAIRARESIGPILSYMEVAEGRPRMDARRALVKITHRTFGMNAETWREWWNRTKDTPWKVPAEKPEDEKREAERAAAPSGGYGRRPLRYHRLTTYSERILFVLDISSSMNDPILVKRGRDTGSRALRDVATPKLKLAREELAFALRGLDKHARFNVIVFETDVRHWKKDAQKATRGNIQAAIRWVQRQKARRGASSGMKSSSGRDSKGRIWGRTNTYGALRAVYGLPVEGRGGVTPGSGERRRRPLWDTVFFLTDGEPTEGEYVKVEEILDEVRRWNKTYKIEINCIGMNATNSMRQLLDGLARITGGRAVYLGK